MKARRWMTEGGPITLMLALAGWMVLSVIWPADGRQTVLDRLPLPEPSVEKAADPAPRPVRLPPPPRPAPPAPETPASETPALAPPPVAMAAVETAEPEAERPRPEPSPPNPQKAKPETHLAAREPVAEPGPSDPATGGALLRLLEHGKGPAIEIAWPDKAEERDRLYRQLTTCHGVQTALLQPDGRLYSVEGRHGEALTLNQDRWSGFLRQADGALPRDEARLLTTIRTRHGLSGGRAVRLFPRPLDALFLADLDRVAQGAFSGAKTIRARYRLMAGRILATEVTLDGQGLDLSIPLRANGCG